VNVVLWIVASLLAAAFLFAGVGKLLRPKEQLAAQMAWVEDFSGGTIKFIGATEILAAVGLVVPPLVDVAPVLAPLAATGLVVLMAGAVVTHLRRHETPMIVINLVLLALAAFVAWGRFGPYSF